MSIERKDIGLDNADRSAKLFTLSLRENDHISAIADNVKTAKARIIEYAKDLAQRIDLKDEKLEITDYYQICTYIKNKVRNKLDVSDGDKINYVNDCLEEYPEYKDHRFDKLTKGSANRSLENLNANTNMNIKKLADRDYIESLNRDDIETTYRILPTIERELERVAREQVIPLFRDQDISIREKTEKEERNEPKISTPKLKPKPGESWMHFKGVQVGDSLWKLAKDWSVLVELINYYPPTKPTKPAKYSKFDLNTASLLGRFKTLVDKLDWYIQALSDKKRSLSPVEWPERSVKIPIFPRHGPDTKKRGVPVLDKDGNPKLDKKGNPITREMTRKNIRKREEKMEKDYQELLNSLKGMEHLVRNMMYNLSQWRDRESPFGSAIATRQDEAHDKLSDSATWRKGCETSEYLDFSIDKLMEQNRKKKKSIS